MTIDNLNVLRNMLKEDSLDGFLVPRADAWPGEFVSQSAERLAWISGFTGSNGTGVILSDKAIVLTDGRYTVQVKKQVNPKKWLTGDLTATPTGNWLAENAPPNSKIGFDPTLYTKADLSILERAVSGTSIEFIPVSQNPIDTLWTDRPSLPTDPVTLFPDTLAGASSAEKRKNLSEVICNNGANAFLMTAPDSIAWLLNIRGSDVPHTPVPLSYGILNTDGSFLWFISKQKVPDSIRQHLGQDVEICTPALLENTLEKISGTLLLDEELTPVKFIQTLKKQGISYQHHEDLVLWPKAIKNKSEQEAIRQTHLVDSQTLIQFHNWVKSKEAKNNFDELSIETHLTELRQAQNGFTGNSFSPIIGFKGNGAIIHYRATHESNTKIKGNGLLLVDSGGQYVCESYAGTTDITRTFAIGKPSTDQILHYTLVLKAHLSVSMTQFPAGTTGSQIDALARSVLWEYGLDFPHGLGHGVGCFLNVHEKSVRFSSSKEGTYPLKPGMLISNEPGLYFEDKYGIRIENLLFVQETGKKDNLGRDILCFETVTFAPYDDDLIDFDLLTEKEKLWLNNYNQKINKITSK
jgi:Xaa-Pro aminopeptidase